MVLVRREDLTEEQITFRLALLRIELAFDVARMLASTLPALEECNPDAPTIAASTDPYQTEPAYAA